MFNFILFIFVLISPTYYLSGSKQHSTSDPSRIRRRLINPRPNSCNLGMALGFQQRATNTPRAETDQEFNIAKNINSIVSAEILTLNKTSKHESGSSSCSNQATPTIVPTLDLKQTLQQKKLLSMCYRSLAFLQLAKNRHPQAVTIIREIEITINHIKSLDHTAHVLDTPKSARNNSGREKLWKDLIEKKTQTKKQHVKSKRYKKKGRSNGKRKKSNRQSIVPKISFENLSHLKDAVTYEEQQPASIHISSSKKNRLLDNLNKLSDTSSSNDLQISFIKSIYALVDSAYSKIQTQKSSQRLTPRRLFPKSPRKSSSKLKKKGKRCQDTLNLLLPTFHFMAQYYTQESKQEHIKTLLSYMQKALTLIKKIESAGYTPIKSNSTSSGIEFCSAICKEHYTPRSTHNKDMKLFDLQNAFIETVRLIMIKQKSIVDPGRNDELYDNWHNPTHITKKIMVNAATKLLSKTTRCDDLIKLNTAIAHIPCLVQHPEIKSLSAQSIMLLKQAAQSDKKHSLLMQSPRK